MSHLPFNVEVRVSDEAVIIGFVVVVLDNAIILTSFVCRVAVVVDDDDGDDDDDGGGSDGGGAVVKKSWRCSIMELIECCCNSSVPTAAWVCAAAATATAEAEPATVTVSVVKDVGDLILLVVIVVRSLWQQNLVRNCHQKQNHLNWTESRIKKNTKKKLQKMNDENIIQRKKK